MMSDEQRVVLGIAGVARARRECVIVRLPGAAVSGSAEAALTPVTPGIAASARSTRSWKAMASGGFGKNSGGIRHAHRQHAARS